MGFHFGSGPTKLILELFYLALQGGALKSEILSCLVPCPSHMHLDFVDQCVDDVGRWSLQLFP